MSARRSAMLGALAAASDEILHDGETVMALRSFQVADEGHRKNSLHFGSAKPSDG